MQHRRLRLGDILDDYCPRERRITNHAVVAMIDDQVKQTRCTTCDADHEYKGARIPPQRRRRPEDGAVDPAQPGRLRSTDEETLVDEERESNGDDADLTETFDLEPLQADEASEDVGGEDEARSSEDEGPVHRRLIRATLPRQDGQVPERKEPEFTIRQPGMRGPDGRKGGRHGRRPMRGPQQGGWQGQQSQRQGPGSGQGQPRHGAGQGNRPQGNRPGEPGGPRGNRQGPPVGGRGGRKRGR